LENKTEILEKEVRRAIKILEDRRRSFDLIFLDPPYGKGLAGGTLEILSRSPIVGADSLIVAEHSPAEPLDEVPFLERVDRRKYGGTLVSFFRRTPDE
jgi:16S rRNA (guanine966-N2)-methyltransferase